ncbi:molybdopterin converting factor, partial [bacterium]
NPLIEVEAVEDRLDAISALGLLDKHDIVLDGTDRLETKFLLNRVCVAWGKPLVVASVHRFEGQLQVVVPGGPCLQCLWPEPPEDGCVGTCAETGVLGVTPGLLGTMQAAETIKLLLGLPVLQGVCMVDLLRSETRTIKLPQRPDCPVCGAGAEPLTGIEVVELRELDHEQYTVVDIREADEVLARPTSLPNLPLSAWETPVSDRPLLLVCASGRRSLALAKRLRSEGIEAFSFVGGVSRLRD